MVNGENNISFCGRDCAYPIDLANDLTTLCYPKMSKRSRTCILSGELCTLNVHSYVQEIFDEIWSWFVGPVLKNTG